MSIVVRALRRRAWLGSPMGLVRASRSGGSHDLRDFPETSERAEAELLPRAYECDVLSPGGITIFGVLLLGSVPQINRRPRLGVGRARMEGVIPVDLGRPGLLDRRRGSNGPVTVDSDSSWVTVTRTTVLFSLSLPMHRSMMREQEGG